MNASLNPLPDPESGLLRIMESVLMAYRHDARQRTFTLITDYPFPSPGSVREFVAFVFSDVDFVREAGERPQHQEHQEQYQAKGPGAIVVQDIELSEAVNGRRTLAVWFGPGFGGVRVTYSEVVAYTRGSVAEQVGAQQWSYRDSRTNEPFEFDYPFPSLIGPSR